jgi:hypothetical protein
MNFHNKSMINLQKPVEYIPTFKISRWQYTYPPFKNQESTCSTESLILSSFLTVYAPDSSDFDCSEKRENIEGEMNAKFQSKTHLQTFF